MLRNRTLSWILLAGAFAASSCSLTKQRDFDRGTRLFEKGQYAEASIEFRRAIQKDSNFGDAYLKLGRAEARQGNSKAASEALLHAVALLPGRAEPKAELAELYVNAYLADPRSLSGFYQQAAQFTSDLLSQDPNSFYGLRLRGYLAIADNKPKEAIENFRRANQVRPDQPDVISLLVQNLFRDGQSEAGESLAWHFIESHKDYGPLYDILYAHFMDLKHPAEAERVLKVKIANNSRNSFYVTQLCRHYWSTGKPEQAKPLLGEITARPREFPEGRLDAGNFYAESGDWTNAAKEFEAGIASSPKNKLTYQKRLATALLSAGRRPEAQKVLDEILKDHSDEDDVRASRAALRVASGNPQDLDQAIADFRALVEKKSGNIKYAYQLGRAYELKGSEEAAKAQYLAILQSGSFDAPTVDALSHLYLREQRFVDAKRYSDMWLTMDAQNPSARLVRSASLFGLGDYRQTRAVLESLLHDYPKLEQAYLQMALLDVTEKRYDQAEALYKIHYQPGRGDLPVLRGIVEMYGAQSQWDKAVAIVQKEVGVFPQSPDLHRLLAETAGRAGQLDLAIEQYRQVRHMRPEAQDIPFQLGLVYDQAGKFDEALTQFQEARRLNPKDPLPPAMAGKVLEQTGRRAEAIASYRESQRLDPENASVMNNLAFALAETNGDLKEAIQMAQRALQKSPDNLEFADTLGWVYLKKKEIPSAVRVFQGLSRRQPKSVTYRIHLAMALLESGDASSAHHELTAAQELRPSPDEQSQIKKLLSRL